MDGALGRVPRSRGAALASNRAAAARRQRRARLQSIEVRNFKKVKSFAVELAPLNILVGTNGSGKSSVLQAIHLACCMIRQADGVRPKYSGTSTVAVEHLDYLPTDEYQRLGHGQPWGNNVKRPGTGVRMRFTLEGQEADAEADCELRSARNAGISITGTVDPALKGELRDKSVFYSALVPGVSGIANREERRSMKVVLRACSFGDSNVVLRNVLLIISERDPDDMRVLEGWLLAVAGVAVNIDVAHEADSDLLVRCTVKTGGESIPLELLGTGLIQLIQIFAYILLLDPGVLLVDEPDTHLHPAVQERLLRQLSAIARERDMRVLITTHSPYMIKTAPRDAAIQWLQDGQIANASRDEIELAMGWGALGKSVLLQSEDKNTHFLRALVAQWPSVESRVALFPGMGYSASLSADHAAEVRTTLGNHYTIVVHRDRDARTASEVAILSAPYDQTSGVDLWITDESDIEAYFVGPEAIASIEGIPVADARAILFEIFTKHHVPIEDQFTKQRRAIQEECYPAGGSPTNDSVMTELANTRNLRHAKGKFVLARLRERNSLLYSDDNVIANLPPRSAESLRALLDR